MYSIRYSFHILTSLNFVESFFLKLKYQISWKIGPVGAKLFPRTDGRTDRRDEANGRFSQFDERA